MNITADKLFVMLVNNNVSNDILRKLEEYDLSALKQISEILESYLTLIEKQNKINDEYSNYTSKIIKTILYSKYYTIKKCISIKKHT